MTAQLDPGHQESQTDWPDPLGRSGRWLWGAWELPAAALSTASAVVLAVIWLWLLHSDRTRALMVLPRWMSGTAALAAAALAWWIAWRCRERPGPRWPRRWTLGLAVGSSATVLLVFLLARHSAVHALALAALAAAVTLAPRLWTLHPDDPMVQRTAPVLGAVMLLGAPLLASVLLQGIEAEKGARIDQRLRDLAQSAKTVREVAGFRWSLDQDPAAALSQVKQLTALHPKEVVGDPDLWRSAASLGQDHKIAAAAGDLADAVVDALLAPNAPRLSSLPDPPVHPLPRQDRWEESPGFHESSQAVGLYYDQLGRLLAELERSADDGTAADPPAAVPAAGGASAAPPAGEGRRWLAQHCAGRREVLEAKLETLAARWTDGWATLLVPAAPGKPARTEPPLSLLLQKRLGGSSGSTLRPADLPVLVQMSYGRMLQAKRPSGCLKILNVHDGDHRVSRLDCYSYSPRAAGDGAELRAEMRLVYATPWPGELGRAQEPEEVFFLFPRPQGQDARAFRTQVMKGLAAASRRTAGQREDDGSGEPADGAAAGGAVAGDRTNSVVDGFQFVAGGKVRSACPLDSHPWTEGREVQQVRVIAAERCADKRAQGNRKAVPR